MLLNCGVGEDSWDSWTARRSNQSILKEITPRCSLEGLMLKLKLQYFGHLMWRADSFENIWCWERLKAGGEGDDRGWDGWMESLTQWTWVWVDSGSWWWTGMPGMQQFTGVAELTEQLNWTEETNTFTDFLRQAQFLPHYQTTYQTPCYKFLFGKWSYGMVAFQLWAEPHS